jgi:hypothetical protein
MDLDFLLNRKVPGQPDFVYDVQTEFHPSTAPNEWQGHMQCILCSLFLLRTDWVKLSVATTGALISSKSWVYSLTDCNPAGVSAIRSVGSSKWTVLIG